MQFYPRLLISVPLTLSNQELAAKLHFAVPLTLSKVQFWLLIGWNHVNGWNAKVKHSKVK